MIAGRTAFFILKDHPNHLSILITAPKEQRVQRLVRKQGISAGEAEKIIEQVDKSRENYVQKFTGTTRYDTRNYDLVINMEGKTEDQIANLILMYLE